jgi:methionyl-tRNA formyltransferase
MRLAFLGTPEPAVVTLRALVSAGHDIVIVITRPDRRRGRGSELSASPVKAAAQELGLRVGHRLADLDDLDVERAIVVAYGAMIPRALLEQLPMLNVHFSLLPRWRGAAPVERAILAGDLETGVSVMTLDEGLDTGPVHLERRVSVGEKTSSELLNELALVGADALLEVLASPELLSSPSAQVGEPTYAQKFTPEIFHLSPTMSRELLLRTVRLGRAFILVSERRLRITAASAVDGPDLAPGLIGIRDGHLAIGLTEGAVELETVQQEGSRSMEARDWWAGARLDEVTAQWS